MRRPPHIVLIEDNPGDVLMLKDALQEHGIEFSLEHYANGEDAVSAFEKMARVPELILLDLNIPRVRGLEVLKIIRGHPVLANAKVAIFTSSLAASDRAESQRLGANAYIVKPPGYMQFTTQVSAAVRKLLEGEVSAGSRPDAHMCHHQVISSLRRQHAWFDDRPVRNPDARPMRSCGFRTKRSR